MLPARFDYVAPRSLDEALSVLSEQADAAKVLAGGQSLIPLMKLRFASPGLLVDLNRIPGLDGVEETGDALRVGALARHNHLARSPVVAATFPMMATAAPLVSDPVVRNLGTLGGSLAHADPAGDWASVMLALRAEVVARSTSGERVIPMTDLIVGPLTTTLRPTEIITEVRVPKPRGRAGGTYLKLERKVGDFATVGVAVQLELSNGTDGGAGGVRIARAGIGLTAVGPQNLTATQAEAVLAGAEPTPEAFAEAGRAAAAQAEPLSDLRGSADYKRQVVATYVRRGLARALELARAA